MAATAEAMMQAPGHMDDPMLTLAPLDGGGFSLAHGVVEVPQALRPVNYTVSLPETLVSPVMHLVIPGFGGIKRSSRGLRDSLAGR